MTPVLIAVIVLVILALAGGGVWWYRRQKGPVASAATSDLEEAPVGSGATGGATGTAASSSGPESCSIADTWVNNSQIALSRVGATGPYQRGVYKDGKIHMFSSQAQSDAWVRKFGRFSAFNKINDNQFRGCTVAPMPPL